MMRQHACAAPPCVSLVVVSRIADQTVLTYHSFIPIMPLTRCLTAVYYSVSLSNGFFFPAACALSLLALFLLVFCSCRLQLPAGSWKQWLLRHIIFYRLKHAKIYCWKKRKSHIRTQSETGTQTSEEHTDLHAQIPVSIRLPDTLHFPFAFRPACSFINVFSCLLTTFFCACAFW